MKKKIVALILMLALVSTFFVGCSLFEKDANRDYHQVVANVSYTTADGSTLTAVVYKGEVKTRINYYGAYYLQYWTVDQLVEYCYNDVARQKLLLLYAQEYLYNNKLIPDGFGFNNLGDWNAFKNKDVKNYVEAYSKFLTVDEFRYCIEQVNEQFDENWQDLIKEREDESAKNEDSSDDETTDKNEDEVKDSDLLEARAQKDRTGEDEEDDEYALNESIKEHKDIVKYFADKYELTLDDSNVANAYFFNYVNAVIRKEADNAKAKIMKSALNEFKKNLEDQYMDYEYFLVQQMQSQIISKYTDHVGTLDAVIKQVEKDYDSRYKSLVASAIASYNDKDNSAYNTAVGDKTFAYAAPSKDYLQVKSILLSFSEKQKSAITYLTDIINSNEDIQKIALNAYATGVVPDEYKDQLTLIDALAELGIKVNVSNPDYDAEEDELKDAYTDASIEDKDKKNPYANPSVDFKTVLIAMAIDIQAKVDKAVKWANDNDMSDTEKYLVKQYASQEAFNDWINLVNDDGGMASSDVYSVTPEGESTSYVEEYTVLARALTNAGVGATTIKDYKTDETLSSGTASYEGTTEILKKANEVGYTIYKEEMKSSVGEFEDELSADVYTLVTDGGAEISFIVNQFGIHIVMVASLPVDENLGTTSEQTAKDPEDKEKDKTFYVKNDDYLYEYSVKIEYKKDKDEEGNETVTEEIEKITVEKKTIKEYLEETLNDELSSNTTRLQQLNLFSDDTYIAKVDKVYKQIVKELEESVG